MIIRQRLEKNYHTILLVWGRTWLTGLLTQPLLFNSHLLLQSRILCLIPDEGPSFFYICIWLKSACSDLEQNVLFCNLLFPREQACSLQIAVWPWPYSQKGSFSTWINFYQEQKSFPETPPLQPIHWPGWQYVSIVKLKPSLARGMELPWSAWTCTCATWGCEETAFLSIQIQSQIIQQGGRDRVSWEDSQPCLHGLACEAGRSPITQTKTWRGGTKGSSQISQWVSPKLVRTHLCWLLSLPSLLRPMCKSVAADAVLNGPAKSRILGLDRSKGRKMSS